MKEIRLPKAASSIQKGVPLKMVLDRAAVEQLSINLACVYPAFPEKAFVKKTMAGISDLTLKERSFWIAEQMKQHLPGNYSKAVNIILKSLTPANIETEDLGLAGMFYMPHAAFIEKYGLDKSYNGGEDPFDLSMNAQYELTKRFTAEFSIRPFIVKEPERTFSVLYAWMEDPDPHVRRLCSEGTRPRLPWAVKLHTLADDPTPSLPILEK